MVGEIAQLSSMDIRSAVGSTAAKTGRREFMIGLAQQLPRLPLLAATHFAPTVAPGTSFKEIIMIGNIAPKINTVTENVGHDQHTASGAPAGGYGKVGARYWDSVGKAWYRKNTTTTWIKIS